MSEFRYEFSELPLAYAEPKAEAGFINGCADIKYAPNGDWHIIPHSICLEGYIKRSLIEREVGLKPWTFVPAPEAIATIIGQRLEGEWFDQVQNAVDEQILADRDAAEENRGDARREYRGAF